MFKIEKIKVKILKNSVIQKIRDQDTLAIYGCMSLSFCVIEKKEIQKYLSISENKLNKSLDYMKNQNYWTLMFLIKVAQTQLLDMCNIFSFQKQGIFFLINFKTNNLKKLISSSKNL